ncbi:DUF4062 domain-containing protein [Spirosoma sp. HMF4905]|uniref:DUF4062 domain-containing protein n=1 Tax=Spirosoma arboris TaxID=2682092 RepID=A0A7K1SK87_9BACT|nr:DUF4062 domain-containing protein [Spirosoma arboris]MVM34158.1 DUF4062 domain-containing protein [Spirosoma arboris]
MSFYKVYISSTFRDLAPYRKTVMETLHKVPNFKVVGMEYYTAESTQPLDRCLQDVADCEIYILILANRYGYIIEGQDKSITHLEYLKAKDLGKVILVFLADNKDGRFPPDADEPGQPSPDDKQAKLKDLKKVVGSAFLLPPEGFTSEYHLALQVMEALVRNPRVDFDGVFPEERKIFCDRANQVYNFYELIRKKEPFNVFLIQGKEEDLSQSLVERLSKYYLVSSDPTSLSFHELIVEPDYEKFKSLLVNELCLKLIPYESEQPSDLVGLLTALKANEVSILTLEVSVSDEVKWQQGYQYLDRILKEFSLASAQVQGIRVYWFIMIDVPDSLQEQVQSVPILKAPPLAMLQRDDIKSWISTYINSDAATVLKLLKLCFTAMPAPPQTFDMLEAQEYLQRFIKRFNVRRKKEDAELLDILP